MLRFAPCACGALHAVRVRRPGWMRLLMPSRALFECDACGCRFLATPAMQAQMGAARSALQSDSGGTDTPPSGQRPKLQQ